MADHPRSRSVAQFNIRLPRELHDRIKAAADSNGRSANAEFVARLEASFRSEPFDLDALADKLADRLKGRSF